MRLLLSALSLLACALLAGPAQSATLTYGLDVEFSGATAPEGTAPWITATFDDATGNPNSVLLTMSANNLVDAEQIGNWHFNFDPVLDPTQLTITLDSVVGTIGATTVSTGVDLFKADGDGLYDILFDFPPPPGGPTAPFQPGESVTYELTYIAPITVASFDFLSTPDGGAGVFFTAAQIQGIGPSDDDSGWIGFVPEPGTGSLLAMGLIGLAMRGRGARH